MNEKFSGVKLTGFDEELDLMAQKIFLEKYPSAVGVALLDNSIGGVVGHDWIVMTAPKELHDRAEEILNFRKWERRLTDVLYFCSFCQSHWMQMPEIRQGSELRQAVFEVIKGGQFRKEEGRCTLCDDDLKTDSDYYGLIYIDPGNINSLLEDICRCRIWGRPRLGNYEKEIMKYEGHSAKGCHK